MNRVDEAFKRVKREDFLPEEEKDRADWDRPLPIGWGQTNSQPTTVRMMLEWLDVKKGQKILDVGAGSGWTTALLSELTGPKGKVHAVERIPELVSFGADNCSKYSVKNAFFHQAGDVVGLPKLAPFDRILVSAAAGKVPEELISQLAAPGRLVIPVRSSILVINKSVSKKISIEEHYGFEFVPLL